MTLRDLNNLYFIEQEIKAYTDKIAELRAVAESITPRYSVTPSGGGVGKKVEQAVISIITYTDMLDEKVVEKMDQCRKVQAYIDSVDDAQTRHIMFLRFVQRKTWGDIAKEIGGGNTASGVRMRIIRYVESHQN